MIKIIKKDLFDIETEALVNTVNTVGVMGKGIALQFKEKFPQNYKEYKNAADNGEVKIGKMFVTENNSLLNPRYIINFPTKEHWKGKSKYEFIEKGLIDLKRVIKENKINSLAMPPIGCGLGGLDWTKVEKLIFDYLKDLSEVDIYLIEPSNVKFSASKHRAKKQPALTRNRLAILSVFKRYTEFGYRLSYLEAQKLVYFLQRFNVKLELKFTENIYGPFCDKLVHVLYDLDGHFIDGIKDKNVRKDDEITIRKHIINQLNETFEQEFPSEDKEKINQIYSFIDGFEFPLGLELLSTVDFVINDKKIDISNSQLIINEVHNWSDRKKELMKNEYIEIALNRLREYSNILYQ